MESAKLLFDGKEYELPVIVGTEGETAVDIRNLRAQTGAITFDSGYGNTGSCSSGIGFIDGERGILRFRGYPIEQLAGSSSFLEVCYLLIYGELPTEEQFKKFHDSVTRHTLIHEDMKKFFEGFPPDAHPMSVLSAMVASLAAYYPVTSDPTTLDMNIIRLIAKIKTLAAFSYKKSIGQPFIYPRNDLDYASDFLHMMFATPAEEYEPNPLLAETLDLLFILHADHEQNCSTSTVRMVGSSGADLFASISAGIGALSGPLHGRANQEVLEMLDLIHADGDNYQKYIAKAKDKNDSFKLMGFGHRVYKNFDPRANIIKEKCDQVLNNLGINDPLLDIARNLEEVALMDSYFIEKKLYPNVDFYSGILYRAMRIPVEMFTVMFTIGRMPGWLAQWKELRDDASMRIYRPRQIYNGATERPYVDIRERELEAEPA
jgi:citrate synthase